MPKSAVCIAWYHEHQWSKVRACSEDSEGMCENYADWLADAERAVKQQESLGLEVHKVYIDVEMLRAWAKKRGLKIDGHTRADYATRLLARSFGLNADV